MNYMTTPAFGATAFGTQPTAFVQPTTTSPGFQQQQTAEGGMSTKVIQQEILNTMRDVSRNLTELKESIVPHKNHSVHIGVQCESCKCTNLIGMRYKCFICENYNLCEKCEMYSNNIHPGHCFIKLKTPEIMQEIIACGLPCSLLEFQSRLTPK